MIILYVFIHSFLNVIYLMTFKNGISVIAKSVDLFHPGSYNNKNLTMFLKNKSNGAEREV